MATEPTPGAPAPAKEPFNFKKSLEANTIWYGLGLLAIGFGSGVGVTTYMKSADKVQAPVQAPAPVSPITQQFYNGVPAPPPPCAQHDFVVPVSLFNTGKGVSYECSHITWAVSVNGNPDGGYPRTAFISGAPEHGFPIGPEQLPTCTDSVGMNFMQMNAQIDCGSADHLTVRWTPPNR